MKPVVITWGFNPQTGKPYLDCYLEVKDTSDTMPLKMMVLRGRFQGTQLALLRIPKECSREYLSEYIESNTPDVISKLHKAKVHHSDLLRKGCPENQAIDFIKYA